MTLPGAGYPLWFVFTAELGMTCALVLAIFGFLSSHQLLRWTPFMTWLLVAALGRSATWRPSGRRLVSTLCGRAQGVNGKAFSPPKLPLYLQKRPPVPC